jgi:pimeloyl-ACP methyl ester carboxylesterase
VIVLLHGTPLTPAVWEPVAALLGGPVACPAVTPHDPARSTAALAREVLAACPGELDLVGHSYGGQVALDAALLAADRVRSLTLVCSRDTPFPPFAATAAALRAGAPVDVEAALDRWFRPDERDGPLAGYARDCLLSADRTAWADALDGIAAYDRSADVPRLRMPVLLLAAEHDPVSTVEAMAALRDRVPGARLEVLAGAAHLSPFTRPERLAELLRAGP